MYRRKLDQAGAFVRAAKQGASYTIDFHALRYRGNG
jgi:hypothetical protein